MNASINIFFKKNYFHIRDGVHFILRKSIKPKSQNEDSKRREFILNILLSGSIFLSLTAAINLSVNFFIYKSAYQGANPALLIILFLFFVFLLFLSRIGYFSIASYLFLGIYIPPIIYTLYKWGIDIPQAILSFGLIIIMAGILISSKFAFKITFFISLVIIFLSYLHINNLAVPNLYWRKNIFGWDDAATFIITFFVIALVSWLSNRETEKSLRRAQNAEADLQKERDSLEIKVAERTRELRELQAEKMLQMHRFAEFGKMAGGLFHDLVNPLTAALLSVDEFKRKYGAELKEKSLDLEKILRNVNRMKIFTEAARKQMQNQDLKGEFSPTEEITMAVDTLSYKARGAKVNLVFAPQKNISKIYGNQIKFYRLMCDLISNAIDSYKSLPEFSGDRQVEIELTQNSNNIVIAVKDYGCGIKKDDKDKIFQPLFTTKEPSEGTGLGLFISKNTVENDFSGKIELKSEEGKGAKFTITIPANINHKK